MYTHTHPLFLSSSLPLSLSLSLSLPLFPPLWRTRLHFVLSSHPVMTDTSQGQGSKLRWGSAVTQHARLETSPSLVGARSRFYQNKGHKSWWTIALSLKVWYVAVKRRREGTTKVSTMFKRHHTCTCTCVQTCIYVCTVHSLGPKNRKGNYELEVEDQTINSPLSCGDLWLNGDIGGCAGMMGVYLKHDDPLARGCFSTGMNKILMAHKTQRLFSVRFPRHYSFSQPAANLLAWSPHSQRAVVGLPLS